MISCEERNDETPLCPHCNAALNKVSCRRLSSTFGKRYIYYCPGCKKVLKSLALYYGARTVGVTELRPYRVYFHIGRDFRHYGEPVPFESGYAVAFTVEMDRRMVRSAPNAPTVMES